MKKNIKKHNDHAVLIPQIFLRGFTEILGDKFFQNHPQSRFVDCLDSEGMYLEDVKVILEDLEVVISSANTLKKLLFANYPELVPKTAKVALPVLKEKKSGRKACDTCESKYCSHDEEEE